MLLIEDPSARAAWVRPLTRIFLPPETLNRLMQSVLSSPTVTRGRGAVMGCSISYCDPIGLLLLMVVCLRYCSLGLQVAALQRLRIAVIKKEWTE